MQLMTNPAVVALTRLLRSTGLTAHIGAWLERNGYESRLNRSIGAAVEPGDCVWDVSANVSYYTARFASAVAKTGEVFAFEPSSRNRAALIAAVAQFSNVSVLRFALSNRQGTVAFQQGDNDLGATSRVVADAGAQESGVAIAETTTGDGLIASAAAPGHNSQQSRPVVLSLLGALWPGHEATGPNQSFASLSHALGREFDFKVIARDRPVGATRATVASRVWIKAQSAHFLYCKATPLGPRGLLRAVRSTPYDILVLNGFFDREFTIPALVMRRLGLLPKRPALLTPHGEFSAGRAARAKPHKRVYIFLARILGLLDGVRLHATTEGEAEDILRHCNWVRDIVVAPTIRVLNAPWSPPPLGTVADRPLRLVFLSRIDRKKNLDYGLDILREAGGPTEFDIYGPVSDEAYWRVCEEKIATMPAGVAVRYRGVIANAEVRETLARYDAFFLPTLGENFGHAIFDALEAGVPVLISDQTPWCNLERSRAGWSLPLDRPQAFLDAIAALRAMGDEKRSALALGARRLAERAVVESDAVQRNQEMFRDAMCGGLRRDRMSSN